MKRWIYIFLLVTLVCGFSQNAEVRGTESTLSEAIQMAMPGDTVILQSDVSDDISIDKSISLDLNGFSVLGVVNVAEGYILTVKDSQTDDYTVEDMAGYGKMERISGDVRSADGYLKIEKTDGFSFHKVDMKLSSVTLRPEAVGIYYNCAFFGDEVVAEYVDVFGIVLRLDQAPDAAYMESSSAYSWYDDFAAGAAGNMTSGTLLKNVMRKGRSSAENSSNSQRKIHGAPYIKTRDGSYYFGARAAYSFMQVVQQADKQWNDLDIVQKNAIKQMYNSFESIISTWYLPNINDKDIDIPI